MQEAGCEMRGLSFGIDSVNLTDGRHGACHLGRKRITQAAGTSLGPGHIRKATQQGGNKEGPRVSLFQATFISNLSGAWV